MKITKTQLKRIIKEEKRKILSESDFEELETDILLSVSSIEKGKTPMTQKRCRV